MWDILFLLVKDYDEEFIKLFIDRLPCESCSNGFKEYMKKYNLNVEKKECYKLLWKIRSRIDSKKYSSKNTNEHLQDYLAYLGLVQKGVIV